MEQEEFCDLYCPMCIRDLKDRYGNIEYDCSIDGDDSNCPFKDVDFTKVTVYSQGRVEFQFGDRFPDGELMKPNQD